ncbi:MAG: hypothetical protein IRY92_08995 [Dactylosporangium sp.]|nr:hypothetical protein [Dactylosporangium sp.]
MLLLALRTAVRACPPEVAAAQLERAGLAVTNFDEDLAATKDTALWLAAKGVRGSSRLAAKGARGSSTLAAKGSRGLGRIWRERIRPT